MCVLCNNPNDDGIVIFLFLSLSKLNILFSPPPFSHKKSSTNKKENKIFFQEEEEKVIASSLTYVQQHKKGLEGSTYL